ncbi:MAG: response regulator, partial [Pseudomonadota bacterium]
YRFLLTDIKMPMMGGLELSRRISEEGGQDLVKVLMTAGVNLDEKELLAGKYGADAVLYKPYTDEQVIEIFEKFQNKKSA